MAHFAELDENNIVKQVIVVSNDDILDENGNESEEIGITFLENLFGHRNWKQTSYNNNFRKVYASPEYIYHENEDGFSPPQPYPSWSLNKETLEWEAPVQKPDDPNMMYHWDEENQEWILQDLGTPESIEDTQPPSD